VFNTNLFQALAPTLNGNAARLKTLCVLISAIIRHRTVNLTVLATIDDGKSCSNESRYRRFQDFFLRFAFCSDSHARLILSRIPKPSDGYVLAMDRTNWKFGRSNINFLVIAIIIGKVSIPIVWKVLPTTTKQGNSNGAQRIDLTKKLLKILPNSEIRALTLDREFIGKKWLTWLDQNGVGYVVRIKKNVWIGSSTAEDRAIARGRRLSTLQNVFGLQLFFGSRKIKKGGNQNHLMVVSNRFEAKEALALYRQRWGIERLFGHLKKKGFDLEATHMTDGAKLEKLFSLVVLAFVLSFAWGCRLRALKHKKSAASNRKSLFRLGLENILSLQERLINRAKEPSELRDFYEWLKSPIFKELFLV